MSKTVDTKLRNSLLSQRISLSTDRRSVSSIFPILASLDVVCTVRNSEKSKMVKIGRINAEKMRRRRRKYSAAENLKKVSDAAN